MLRVLTRAQHFRPRTVHSIRHSTYQISRICLHSTMAQPVASSSHPAQIPALEGPHIGQNGQNEGKKHKEKKEKVATVGGQPLEVCHFGQFTCACSHARTAESQARVLRPSHQNVRPAEGGIRRVGQRCAPPSSSAARHPSRSMQHNRVKRSKSRCLTARSGKGPVGKRARWTLQRRSQKA